MNRLIKSEANQSLLLSTMAFAIAFACWGVISGIAPLLKQELGLSITQVSIMVAIPVLQFALRRIPLGILADRFGGVIG